MFCDTVSLNFAAEMKQTDLNNTIDFLQLVSIC